MTMPAARWRAVAIWLLLMLLGIAVAAHAKFVADLSAFLPSAPTPEQRVLMEQLQSGIASRVMTIGLRGADAEQRAVASRRLADELRRNGLFDSVNNGDRASLREAGEFLFARRYLLSPGVDMQRFTVDGLRSAIDETVALLGTPAGSAVKPLLWRDPTGETMRMTESMLPPTSPRVEAGVWASRTVPRAVLVAVTKAQGSDLDAQAKAAQAVRDAFAPSAAQGLTLELSGQGVLSVESRRRIESEVHRLALAGTLIIAMLLLLSFGSVKALMVGTLPVTSGVLAGVAAVQLGFGHVHGITLGFGTTLIGEAVDYAIYYLIQARPAALDRPDEYGCMRWRIDSWPTVRLGTLTSVAGFAALMFSGFPGLAQLGLFSVAGLFAAAYTTRYVMPAFAPNGAGRGLRAPLGRLAASATRELPRLRWPLAALSLAAVVVLSTRHDLWRGDLAGLSPLPAPALALEESLRNDLGAPEDGRLIAIEAPDDVIALERAEAVAQRLDVLVVSGRVLGYQSPAKLLPSPALQMARQAALPDETTLRARLVEATAGGPLPAAKLEPFIAEVQAQRKLAPLTRMALANTPLDGPLQAQLTRQADGRWTALISVQIASGAALSRDELATAVHDIPDARVVEIQRELDALYAHYLHQAMWQALFGALVVVMLLAARLRSWRRVVRVTLPLAASVALVMGTAALVGASLGILHLVGLLLVVAVGSNYALFFDQTASSGNAEADTLSSLLLANVTLVTSFALLAFSAVPPLSAVGWMVAPGSLLCLILSASFMGPLPPSADTVGKSPS